MGIFDVLRYPISTPPTVEEINRLPLHLQEQFISMVLVHFRKSPNAVEHSVRLMWIICRQPANKPRAEIIIKDIKKLIREL